MSLPKSINNLSMALSSMPGVGPKLSNRLALYLSLKGKDLSKRLSEALQDVGNQIVLCSTCGNVTDEVECSICMDEQRDRSIVMLVEDALDLESIESTNTYNGLYHVLNGRISPVNGIGPDDLNLVNFFKRLENVTEVIFSLNPDVEGDATSMYIKNEIEKRGLMADIKITRLAKGIPVGSDIEFMSSQTLRDSMSSRTTF